MKTRWMALMGAAIALTGCQNPPRVEDAWVRLPAVPGRPAAGYATVSGGSSTTALIGVTTSAAARSELHESMTGHGGMAAMRPLKELSFAQDKQVLLRPGGAHVMLFDVKPGLRPGATIPLTFRFDGWEDVTVDAKLVGAGDPAPK
ncbi:MULTISPECIES: copper chaperone PCu(A)C [unclassified Sphingomonas]|uniref:copper chaperone PCu(A)C n=1 Tax=unclassified Sphingomonas TaxID=196159 RepID=UPI0006F5D6A3|nr:MULTISPECIES: copper chaperone PCu(A)C [unclassified Sphingomonas]KQM28925.1 hypothetical protein ASE58_03485 [Sphingomonas sp. Leaf9]KQM45626.1 hypothetical protein ASE57_03475 [Sphingomonas sp. Leaf11]